MAGAECDGDMRAVIDFAEWLVKNGQAYIYIYIGALISRIGFWGPLYSAYNEEQESQVAGVHALAAPLDCSMYVPLQSMLRRIGIKA